MRARNGILAAIVTIAVALAVWAVVRFTSTAEIPVAVARRGEFTISITRSGEIKARRSITISAPTVGEKLIITRLIPEGTFVKKGDVLIEFDTTDLLERLESAERDLVSARAELELTSAKNHLREKEMLEEIRKKDLALRQAAGGSPVEIENARQNLALARVKYETELKVMQAELVKAEADIERARERVESARESLAELTVRAPSDGLVIHEKVWRSGRHSKVQEGDSPWPMQPIISLPDLSTLYVSTDVDEIDISRIQEGQGCELTLEAYPETPFSGRVSTVGNLARSKYFGSGPNVFDVSVDPESIDSRFRPGMKVRVEILIDEFRDRISVPIDAVFSGDGETVVYVRRGRSFEERRIVAGRRNDTHVIVEDGLEGSEKVALVSPFEKREE